MPLDQTKLGMVAAQLMDQLADQYGDDATISHVIVIAAIETPHQDTVHLAASEGIAQYVAIGMLRKAFTMVEAA